MIDNFTFNQRKVILYLTEVGRRSRPDEERGVRGGGGVGRSRRENITDEHKKKWETLRGPHRRRGNCRIHQRRG